MELSIFEQTKVLRVLVVLASYGNSNDSYLLKIVDEYRSMSFDVDIVILSNLDKKLDAKIEVVVGLPAKDPWSLPFAHKQIFSNWLDDYDLFVYSEDDILLTERNLRALLDVTAVLRDDEIAGFIRIEKGPNGEVNFPDAHAHFHWDTTSVRVRANYTLAKFTNEHAACYSLTQDQLRKAIKSGGFLVAPHEWKYDLLCSAATDPYTQCGFTKLIPISHFDDFTVHHMSNKYVGKMGVDGTEMRRQVDRLLWLAKNEHGPPLLTTTETGLWRQTYSKDFYEPVCNEVISMIPPNAQTVLSIGSGSGAIERWLAEKGLRVVAMPLDDVIFGSAVARGVETLLGDFRDFNEKLQGQRFDCVLCLNVLHLVRDPIGVLCLFKDVLSVGSRLVIQLPNMKCLPAVWRRTWSPEHFRGLGSFDSSGVHLVSPRTIQGWFQSAGFTIEVTKGIIHQRAEIVRNMTPNVIRRLLPEFIKLSVAASFVTAAKNRS